MKNTTKLPTILGVLVLVVGLVAGLFLINRAQVFKLGANEEASPKNVRFSNATDTSLTVTWTTDIESTGLVKWGATSSSLSEVTAEENTVKSFVHSVNLTGIKADSDVYIKINSNGKDYDNNGIVWQSKTNAFEISPKDTKLASGVVLNPDGTTPATALVYLTVNGSLLSSMTSGEGSFVIPISAYVEAVADTAVIEISITDGLSNVTQAVIYPPAIKSTPTMILGRTYDFRTITVTGSDSEPKSSLSIPESIEISSRFEIVKSQPAQAGSVSIESIDDGEIITTTDPEFFGSAPKSTEIEIQIESELQTDTITAGTNGKWSWSPPKDLEPGEHKVTIKWKDASGIVRTLTRSFIVAAAEGPAFESTPSATTVAKATSTPVATTVPAVTTEPSEILEPTPETGSLTPTIGLFIMGIGILLSSIFVYNKSYA